MVPLSDSKATRERDVSSDLALRKRILYRVISSEPFSMNVGRLETCQGESIPIYSSPSAFNSEETTASSLEFIQASSKAISGKSVKFIEA